MYRPPKFTDGAVRKWYSPPSSRSGFISHLGTVKNQMICLTRRFLCPGLFVLLQPSRSVSHMSVHASTPVLPFAHGIYQPGSTPALPPAPDLLPGRFLGDPSKGKLLLLSPQLYPCAVSPHPGWHPSCRLRVMLISSRPGSSARFK